MIAGDLLRAVKQTFVKNVWINGYIPKTIEVILGAECVDPNEFTLVVDQWTTGVSAIDRGARIVPSLTQY